MECTSVCRQARAEQDKDKGDKVVDRYEAPWCDSKLGMNWPAFLAQLMFLDSSRPVAVKDPNSIKVMAGYFLQVISGKRDWRTGEQQNPPDLDHFEKIQNALRGIS